VPSQHWYETEQEFVERRLLAKRTIQQGSTLVTTPCWLWEGYLNHKGYGFIYLDYKRYFVHRVSFELYKGPIPDGLEPDHLCMVHRCFYPEHLEAVTHAVNVQRAFDTARGGE
jgi:hypothetical protein